MPREEVVNGVQVHRVASSRFGRKSLVGRSVDYLSFYRSVRRRLLDMERADDIVIAKTDPPLLAIVMPYQPRELLPYSLAAALGSASRGRVVPKQG